MVLSGLALSILGLFRYMRQATLVPSRSPRQTLASSDMEVISLREDDRVGLQPTSQSSLMHAPAVGVGLERAVERAGDRDGADRGFMMAARAQALVTPSGLRTTSSKRKLEEFEIGMAESSLSATSQVRARREAREEVLEGSIAESSGRERYDAAGVLGPGEAQSLDGESQMREEGGNAAIDDDSTWDEEPNWNGITLEALCEASKGGPDKVEENSKGDEGSGIEELDDPGSNLQALLVMVVDPTSSPSGVIAGSNSAVNSSGILSVSTSGMLNVVEGSEIGRNDFGRSVVGDDGDPGKEPELDVDWETDMERDGVTEGQEESISGGYVSANTVVNMLGESSVSSNAGQSSVGTPSRIVGSTVTDMEVRPSRLQFFVRTYIDGRTIVLHANGSDLVESVHQQILVKTGLPVSEQRLIFGRLQLQQDQTLDSCHVCNDATLYLVARMRSTALPASWQLINDLVATIRHMCAVGDQQGQLGPRLMHSQDCVRASVQEFLKMAVKSVPVSEHMQVFELAGATSALVMLLLSPVDTNRECAEDSITLFLSSNDEYLPPHIHCHCAPVLLDFCKLLAKSAPSHNLYSSCRQALARLLDTVGVAHGSPYFNEAKAESIVHDFAPFVNELSSRLTGNLRWTARAYGNKDSTVNFSTYVKEAKDFTAFVIPLCKAMEVCKGIEASGSASGTEGSPGARVRLLPECLDDSDEVGEPDVLLSGETSCKVKTDFDHTRNIAAGVGAEIGSHGWLRQLFKDLLQEIDNCLEGVGHMADKHQESSGAVVSVLEDRPFGWAPFLIVLKGLHAVAKLYEGAMVDLLEMLRLRRAALNMLIRQSKWQDDDVWLLDHKTLLDFESKRRLVMAMLPEPQDDHDERQEIVVKRAQLLSESFELLAYVEPEVLQGGISVEFATEEATGPGVLREWFSMICREIFNPQNALFLACPNDRRRFFPNAASGVNPGHLTYFRFCGRVIALALMHRVQMDVVFALTFFKQLAGLPVVWEDAKDADPFLYDSCKKILEMEPEVVDTDALGLTFVSEVEELGSRKTMELCMGGKDMVVNSDNRRHFVELLVQRRLVAAVAEQVKSFSQGFSDLLLNTTHQQFLRALEPEDLDLMLYGKDRNICLEDWKAHTEYHDYSVSDTQILWFWQVAEGMSAEQRRRLLFFSTSVTHLPAEGFAGLTSKFHIHRAHTDISWLPTAHTCFYQLVLPPYPTYEIMSTRLQAITECHIAEGFGFA